MKEYPENSDSPYTLVEAAVMLFALLCGAAIGLAALPPSEPRPLPGRFAASAQERPASHALESEGRR